MKTTKFLLAGLLFSLTVLSVFGQTKADKKVEELKSLKTAVENARAKVRECERQMSTADSLINEGSMMITEAKIETKNINEEQKRLEKEHADVQKPLLKESNSKDAAAAASAKAELEKSDAKYKENVKDMQNRLQEAAKKSNTGSENLTKGNAAKKSAEEAMKGAKADLETANKKLEAARSGK